MRNAFIATATAVAVSFCSSSALAQEVPSAAIAKPMKEKIVCRQRPSTGSRISRGSVCHTATEWIAIDTATAAGNSNVNESRGHAL